MRAGRPLPFDEALGRQRIGRLFDRCPADGEDLDQIHLAGHFATDFAGLCDAFEDDLLDLMVERHGRLDVERESLRRTKQGGSHRPPGSEIGGRRGMTTGERFATWFCRR